MGERVVSGQLGVHACGQIRCSLRDQAEKMMDAGCRTGRKWQHLGLAHPRGQALRPVLGPPLVQHLSLHDDAAQFEARRTGEVQVLAGPRHELTGQHRLPAEDGWLRILAAEHSQQVTVAPHVATLAQGLVGLFTDETHAGQLHEVNGTCEGAGRHLLVFEVPAPLGDGLLTCIVGVHGVAPHSMKGFGTAVGGRHVGGLWDKPRSKYANFR